MPNEQRRKLNTECDLTDNLTLCERPGAKYSYRARWSISPTLSLVTAGLTEEHSGNSQQLARKEKHLLSPMLHTTHPRMGSAVIHMPCSSPSLVGPSSVSRATNDCGKNTCRASFVGSAHRKLSVVLSTACGEAENWILREAAVVSVSGYVSIL